MRPQKLLTFFFLYIYGYAFSQSAFHTGGVAGMYSYRCQYVNPGLLLDENNAKKFTPFSGGSFFSAHAGDTQEGYQKTNGFERLSTALIKRNDSVAVPYNTFYLNFSYGGFLNRWTTSRNLIRVPNYYNAGSDKVELTVGYRYKKNLFETGFGSVNSFYFFYFDDQPQKRGEQYDWIPIRYKRAVVSAFKGQLEIMPSAGVGLFIHEGLSEATYAAPNQLAGHNQKLNRFVGGIEGGVDAIWNFQKWGIGISSRYLYGFQPSHYLAIDSPQGRGVVYAYLQGWALEGQVHYNFLRNDKLPSYPITRDTKLIALGVTGFILSVIISPYWWP